MLLHGLDSDDRSARHPRELGGVHLEAHGRKITEAAPAVGQHDQLEDWPEARLRRQSLHECRHDAGSGQIDLIEQDEGIDVFGHVR